MMRYLTGVTDFIFSVLSRCDFAVFFVVSYTSMYMPYDYAIMDNPCH